MWINKESYGSRWNRPIVEGELIPEGGFKARPKKANGSLGRDEPPSDQLAVYRNMSTLGF